MRKLLLATFVIFSLKATTQNLHAGIFGGISNYQGDVVGRAFVSRFTKPAVGLEATYDLSDQVSIRGGFTWAKIAGDDRYNSKKYLRERNLSFASNIREASLVAIYNIFNSQPLRWTPYVFAGFAVFHFDPYTYDSSHQKIYLKPLSTEGEGLTQYPDRKPYALTQLSIPFGAGIKYAMTDRLDIGIETGIRKTFTDYLDDVSKTYVDAGDLMAARGPKAVELSYRGNEVPGNTAPYPPKGAQRGSNAKKDIYYFTGIHLNYLLGTGDGKKGRSKTGCPSVN